ncbi:MAG: CCA tRNA nucleotidyltransferase [Candidatus Shapirobacteria bacterium]
MVNKLISRLCAAGHEVYLVGGAVRDLLLDKKVADEDLVTSAKPDEIIELFSDLEVNLVGKTFGVVIVNGIELATFRSDVYDTPGKAEVTYADSIEEDLSRRDLTINALAMCPLSGDIVDLHDGKIHLKDRIIKFVGNPVDRIKEDPVRIIRAARFKAAINGVFDPKTLFALREFGYMVAENVAPERIRLEVLKAMKIKKASRFFNALHELGILWSVFPSLEHTIDFNGGKYHGETVFEHNMLTGDHISPKYKLLKLAAYLHDVGKPISFKDDHFLEHEDIGAEIVRRELFALRFSKNEIEYVTSIIKVHMNLVANLTPRASRRLLKRLADTEISFYDFLRMKMADRAGNLAKENRPFSHLVALVKKFKKVNAPSKVTQLALNGHDIQNLLGVGPGREVGRVLKTLLEFVLENGEEFNNREKLIECVKNGFRTG